MVVVAAFTVRNRAGDVPSILPLALIATATVGAVSLGVIFGFGIFPVDGAHAHPAGRDDDRQLDDVGGGGRPAGHR